MKKILPILGCIFVAILVMPAFVQKPAKNDLQEQAVKAEAKKMLEAFTAYHHKFGAYPVGDAAAVLRELGGENPEKQVFFELQPAKLNERGELIDPWGTPYRITGGTLQQLPLIHSAGKNHLFEDLSAKRADDFRSRQEDE